MRKWLLVNSFFIFTFACSQHHKTTPVNNDEQVKKEDSSGKQEVVEIKHGSPEPAKLDSIKQAKLKMKKGN